jgi:putative membrane protein
MGKERYLRTFFKGIAMGLADIVPGVSGGTVALILGFYERLIRGISNIKPDTIKNTLKREKNGIDVKLFAPLGAGIALAFLIMSNIILFLLEDMASITYAFFFTLILGSAVLLLRSEKLASVFNLIFIFVGFIIAFIFVGMDATSYGHSLPVIFISGIIAITAMILPGISGALLMLFLNQYEYMLDALRSLNIIEIFTFMAGAIIGLLAFSRVLNKLLESYRAQTVALLIGLMLGALRLCYDNITFDSTTIFPIWVAGLIGFGIVFILEAGRIKSTRKSNR